MINGIARPFTGNQRIFPIISPSLYDPFPQETAETVDQTAARRLLAMASQSCSVRERFGLLVDDLGLIRRLLSMHRLGMKAELAGQFARADFFWSEIMWSIERLAPDHSAWAETTAFLASSEALDVLNGPDELRDQLIHELLIDTHCAFFNTYLAASTPPDSRAFHHARYLKNLVNLVPSTEDLRIAILGESALIQVDAYLTAEQPDNALRLVCELNDMFPNHIPYQDKASEVHFVVAAKNLSSKSTSEASLNEAKELSKRIGDLQEYLRTHPYCLACFDVLASLYHIHAVKLANGSRPSQGLAAVEMALAYKPNWSEAKQSRQRIEANLRNLQREMRKIESKLGTRKSADGIEVRKLSPEGEALHREADAGFGPRDGVRRHSADEIAKKLAQALAVNKWLALGLPPPTDGDWGHKAECLLKMIDLLAAKNPTDTHSLIAALDDVRADHPELRPDVIGDDLIQRCFLRASHEQAAAMPQNHIPSFPSVPTQTRPDHEPFDLWLFSRRDIRLKVEAGVATLLLVIGLFLLRLDAQYRQVRDLAFKQVRPAVERTDDAAVLKTAEQFLESPPLRGDDPRLAQVKDWYTEAFTRWFVRRPDGPLTKSQVDRYRKLSSEVKP